MKIILEIKVKLTKLLLIAICYNEILYNKYAYCVHLMLPVNLFTIIYYLQTFSDWFGAKMT